MTKTEAVLEALDTISSSRIVAKRIEEYHKTFDGNPGGVGISRLLANLYDDEPMLSGGEKVVLKFALMLWNLNRECSVADLALVDNGIRDRLLAILQGLWR